MIQSVSADVHNIRRQLQRRQVPAACTTSCAWLTPLSNCASTDLTCLCGIVNGAGADVQTCATCLQPTNPDITTDIQEVAELCPSSGAPPITEPAGTTTAGSVTLAGTATTTTPSTVTDTDCSSVCDPIVSAEASCTADSCFCPTVVVAGPACSQCLLNSNATVASSIGVAINICNSEFPSTATTGAGSTGCSSQCALINQALTACTDEACFCTTLIGEGPACSQCYATVNITEASILSGALVTCQSLLPGVTGIPSGNATTKGPTLTGFPTTQSTAQTIALTGSTSSSHSAGMSDFDGIFEGSFVGWVTVLALVGGVFGVFI